MTPELYKFGKQLSNGLKTHHVVLFISTLCILLSIGIFVMYQTTQSTFTIPNVTTSTITDFNQKTIQEIKDLHDSTTKTTVTLPSPRPNPFTE